MRFRAFLLALSFVSFAHAVDVRDYGAIPNDSTPDTAAIVAAMGAGDQTVTVPPGEFLVGKFEIPARTVLLLSPGTVLRDTGQLSAIERLINIRTAGVRIYGTGASVVSRRSDYTTGEQRHGVFIFGATDLIIEGLESNTHGGDGFYVGTGSRDVTLRKVFAFNNRRQGLSIVSAVNLLVIDSEFTSTQGTWPMLGIDVEPNNNGDLLQNVQLRTVRTSNNAGGGITVGLSAYSSAAPAASITIVGHTSSGENPVFRKSGTRLIDRVLYSPTVGR